MKKDKWLAIIDAKLDEGFEALRSASLSSESSKGLMNCIRQLISLRMQTRCLWDPIPNPDDNEDDPF